MLSAIVRLPGGGSPLAGDEALTFNQFAFQPWRELVLNYLEPNQHTLFSILSNISLSVFGENEWSFRLPSLLSGILGPPLTCLTALKCTGKRPAALMAGILMTFSTQHIVYSQVGRGYALTVILALVFILSLKSIIHNGNRYIARVALLISGFSLVLTLPTNALFLAGAGIFSLITALENRKINPVFFKKSFIRLFFLLTSLALICCAYLANISEGLVAGFQGFQPQPITIGSLINLFRPWTEPYGIWLYLFFAAGCLSLKSNRQKFAFLSLFIIPVAIMAGFGRFGFYRIYIYWLPFILIFSGLGISTVFSKLHHQSPGKRIALAGALSGLFVIPVYNQLTEYYEYRSSVNEASISEARQLSSYLDKNVSGKTFIISLPGLKKSSVLVHYLEPRIGADMLRFLSGEKPERFVIIAHRNLPPDKFRMGGYFPDNYFQFPKSSFREIHQSGNLRLHELKFQAHRFIPPAPDPDYETRIRLPKVKEVISDFTGEKIIGNRSITITKNVREALTIKGTEIKTVQLEKAGYILLGYLKPYGSRSKLVLWDKARMNEPPKTAYLNPYIGQATASGSRKKWQMVFILYPIPAGTNALAEIFYMEDPVAAFDGVQTFLLAPKPD